jgi:hypothetical protein
MRGGAREQRRLDLEAACSSLYDFCVRRLGMGEDEARRDVASAVEPVADGSAPARIGESPTPARNENGQAPATATLKLSNVEPLAPERYRVQFTASEALKNKLERVTDLMRHRNPSGDLGAVVESAIDLLLEKLERERLGKAKRPAAQKVAKSTQPGHVARAVRREVFERDGERCSFVDDTGHRCDARGFLELDHKTPRALGGGGEAANLRVRCRRHNQLAAEWVPASAHRMSAPCPSLAAIVLHAGASMSRAERACGPHSITRASS